MERILIVRLGAMGDVIHALPAAAALRAGLPGVQIGWVIEEHWADLLAAPDATGPGGTPQKPLVDRLHLVDTRAWRAAPFSDGTWSEIRNARQDLKAARYDATIDLQGLLKSAVFAQLSGAPTRIGFAHPKERLATIAYTRKVEATAAHVVDQNLELASALAHGPRPATEDLLPHDPAAEAWCSAELQRRAVRQFVLMSPGAGWGAKIWPAERYGEVALSLAAAGITTLINFAPGEEDLAKDLVIASDGSAQAIQCSIAELIVLIRRARLFIGGDCGPMHLAAALGIPVVAIFGPTDPARNGPYGTHSIVLRSPESRTSYSHVEQSNATLLQITAAEVAAAAHRLLGAA